VSIASLVRQAVVALLDEAADRERRDRARTAAGRYRWAGLGADHDDAFGE